MTGDKIALRELLEQGSDTTMLREMIGFAAQRLMELETDTLCGAGHGERSESRTNQRNGYRDRDWQTLAGTVELRIPTLRHGSVSVWPATCGEVKPGSPILRSCEELPSMGADRSLSGAC